MVGRWWLMMLGGALVALLVACSTQPNSVWTATIMAPTPTVAPGPAVPWLAPTATPPVESPLWQELEARPLRLPTLAPGAACPQLQGARVDPAYGAALGDGPIYPIYGPENLLRFARSNRDSAAGVFWQKTLWVAAPDYKAPALIRGRQIDGPGGLGFTIGSGTPQPALRFESVTGVSSEGAARGWRDRPSLTAIPGPGCYAFQVDGVGFTDVIVFEVQVN